ncbi:hypothetical protein LSAT2_016878 [Lamellibrachia satsuma]|nr:hypothetical protein LSAT2_016878 [Lamellibrachia satsuma]
MRASFLLLLCVVLLATAAFANEAKSDVVSVDKQSEKLTGEVDRVKRRAWGRRRWRWRWRWRRPRWRRYWWKPRIWRRRYMK